MNDVHLHESHQPAFIPRLEKAITRFVESNAGIRDTALSISMLVEFADDPEFKSRKDGKYAATVIAWTMHRMILTGQLVAIDAETADNSYTYIMPAQTRIKMAIPISVNNQPVCVGCGRKKVNGFCTGCA